MGVSVEGRRILWAAGESPWATEPDQPERQGPWALLSRALKGGRRAAVGHYRRRRAGHGGRDEPSNLSLPFRIALPGVCASLQRLRTSSSSTTLRWLARTSLGRISPPDRTQLDCCYPALDRTSSPFLTHRTAPRHLAG